MRPKNGTHCLVIASEGTAQDTEKMLLSEGHSRTGDHVIRNKLEHRKSATKRGALTPW